MPCLVAGDVLDEDDGRVDVELLTKSDVEGLVTRSSHWGVQDTLETQLVALERSDGFAEELLGVLASSLHTRDIDLLPLDGHIVGLEDGLDRLGNLSTDTVTCEYPLSPAATLSFHVLSFLWRIPGIKVTVYLPPNLVGLKMSDDTVAYAMSLCQSINHSRCESVGRVHRAAVDGDGRALLRRA